MIIYVFEEPEVTFKLLLIRPYNLKISSDGFKIGLFAVN